MGKESHPTVPHGSYSHKDPANNESNRYSNDTSSPLLTHMSPKTDHPHLVHNISLKAKLLMLLPLSVHFLGSLAIFFALLYWVHGCALFIERQPRVKLADGTENSKYLGRYNILQSDVVTILSGALMVLRWVAGAWAGPLCWRAIFLLAEKHGVCRRDIDWITSFGLLPPSAYFQRTSSLLIGTILILTLAPFASSPLLTGSITWVPGNNTLDLSSASGNYTINYTGTSDVIPQVAPDYPTYFEMDVVRRLSRAWGQKDRSDVFKRVTDSVANLSIGSTVQDIILPYLEIKSLEWLPNPNNSQLQQTLTSMSNRTEFFSDPFSKIMQPGAVVVLVDVTPDSSLEIPTIWSLLFNVRQEDPKPNNTIYKPCEYGELLLPKNSNIPYFTFIDDRLNGSGTSSCFAYANLAFNVGSGHCRGCRVSSYSTVQNDTALEMVTSGAPDSASGLVHNSLGDMILYLPTLNRFKDFLPDLSNDGLDAYTRALITRSYSAIWNVWTDMSGYDSPALASSYSPVYPTLTAYINRPRAYAWLVLQLLLTVAGLAFLWLQGSSKYPLYTDTSMVAFDLDTTKITRLDPSNKKEPKEALQFEPKEDVWRAVVVKRLPSSKDEE